MASRMWHFRQHITVGIACAVMAAASPAFAYDALIEGAKQCTQYFPIKEREQQIPVHLLAAISTIETGRYHKGLDMALPWPWTINIEGKGYYLNSKAEAIAKTREHLAQGATSIDVGCMQVNLKHHPKAFANLNDAFDPAKNVDYAARFLQTNYQEMGSWVKAAASYHSRTPSRGNPYLDKVGKAWQRIVSKVQQAQARSGVAQAVQADAAVPKETTAPQYRVVNPTPQNRIESTRGVKVITVGDEPQARTIERAPVMVTSPAVKVERATVSVAPVANAGIEAGGKKPNFVFAD